MNCLEFRRELNIDPHSDSAAFVAHARACARCAQAHADAVAFEIALGRSLDIPVPANLAESILLAQATDQRHARAHWRRRGGWLALAAAAVLAVGVGWRATRAEPLGGAAIAHMLGAEAPALAMTAPVGDDAVRKAFAQRGIALGDVPADISYVQCCPIGKFKSVHMVMPRASGPVTVMYLADDRSATTRDFQRDGWHGRSVPMGHGTLLMIGHDPAQFAQVEREWQGSLRSAARI